VKKANGFQAYKPRQYRLNINGVTMQERPLDPPEHKPYTGRCVFAAYINDVTVYVRAFVLNDQIEHDYTEVWYCDAEVSALLHESQLDSLQAQFDANYHDIITFGELE
jgi:hypothetical protein